MTPGQEWCWQLTVRNTLGNPAVWSRFLRWARTNLADPESFEQVDWTGEFGRDLTYSEAIELALFKFPALWRSETRDAFTKKVKQLVFIPPLIPRILTGEVQVTYRKTPKRGLYYAIGNRFRPPRDPRTVLEFFRVEPVDPLRLTDAEAQLAGIDTAEELRRLLRKWYGDPLPNPIFRNWFRVLS